MTNQPISQLVFSAKTPGQKAAATKKLNAFVADRVSEGKNEKWVRAGIRARVTRLSKVSP